MKSYETFDLVIENGPIAEIRFNRPDKHNALAASFWEDLPQALELVESSLAARVLLLSSKGKHFSAGMDLDFFAAVLEKRKEEDGRFREWLYREILRLQNAITRLETIRVPVISVIQGGCIGGALDLVCAANIRYCTSDAYFSIHEINVGMTADLGTLQRLPKLISPSIVHELAFTGGKLEAAEAKESGLVSRVFACQEEALAYALETARCIAAKSPLAVAGIKKALNHARDHSVADGLDHMAAWNAAMFVTEDVELAINAQRRCNIAEFKDLLPG